MGIEINGEFKAYPFSQLSKNGKPDFIDSVAGQALRVHWDEDANSAYITDLENNELPSTTLFWFAWYTFNPDTEVFVADNKP